MIERKKKESGGVFFKRVTKEGKIGRGVFYRATLWNCGGKRAELMGNNREFVLKRMIRRSTESL